MKNSEIQLRFEDWLSNPGEDLDFEAKCWLDMDDEDHQAKIAKSLIALENHGGGFLIIGFREEGKRLVPDSSRPTNLDAYSTDAINAIVRSYAEPSFQVTVTIQTDSFLGATYPLVSVRGNSTVPVRSFRQRGKAIANNVYYVRATGPQSRSPEDASEWHALINRVVLKQRSEIVALLRAFLPVNNSPEPTPSSALEAYASNRLTHWESLNGLLPDTASAKIRKGYFAFAAHVEGVSRNLSITQVNEANQRARKYTGWPALLVTHGLAEAAPHEADFGGVEAWFGKIVGADVGHADYWHIDPAGNFILIRGYQEDTGRFDNRDVEPGSELEVSLPVWRLGEFLLRIVELTEPMFEPEATIALSATWTGLKGRHLVSGNFRRYLHDRKATGDQASGRGEFSVAQIRDLLPDVVKQMTANLYLQFELFVPPADFFTEEISRMMQRAG